MTKLFDKTEGFPLIRWIEGFAIGVMLVIVLSLFTPDPKPVVVRVPEVRVVEKPVIVRKPVYLNHNDRQQIQCLAENAYFEAGNQNQRGKVAVTNVVMNRVADRRFPSTACAVVHQRSGGVCQFSWVCEGKKRIRDARMFAAARKAAEDVYLRNIGDVTRGAKFYHADYVNPGWTHLARVTKIGDHIFYRG